MPSKTRSEETACGAFDLPPRSRLFSSRQLRRRRRRRPAARSGSPIATTRPAPRSTRRRRSRPSCRSWRSTTTSWSSIPQPSRTRPTTSCPTSRPSGRGATTAQDLTFKLRDGVKWHDGKPFTAADVKCTWDMLISPEFEAAQEPAQVRGSSTSRRWRPTATARSPSISAGRSPRCSPCSPAACRRSIPATCRRRRCARSRSAPARSSSSSSSRTNSIKLVKNPDYWKKGRPYLDAHRVHHHPQPRDRRCWPSSPASIDLTFTADIARPRSSRTSRPRRRGRSARCCRPTPRPTCWSIATSRRSTMPTCARRWCWRSTARPSTRSSARAPTALGGTMLPPPEGLWGMPPEFLATVAGYGADHEKQRAEGRKIMESWATAPTSRSRSRSRPATSRPIATRR